MLISKKINNIDSVSVTNLVFAFFPISFILGNLFSNLNLVLFCCLGIFHLRSKILTTRFDLPLKIIFLFFLVIFFSTTLSLIKALYFEEYEQQHLIRFFKSIAFFRFYLLLLIIYLLKNLGILNFKYFFASAIFAPLLVSLDVIFQYIFGFDMVGIKSNEWRYNSGFFGDELIAGGFIKSFSFFAIFFLAYKFKNKNILGFLLTLFVISFLGVGILLSGNKMPLILFFIGLFLTFLINQNLRKLILASFLVLLTIFTIIGAFDKKERTVMHYFTYFFPQGKSALISVFGTEENEKKDTSDSEVKSDASKEDIDVRKIAREYENFKKLPNWNKGEPVYDDFEFFWVMQSGQSGYKKIFLTALDVWEKNKIFGNGIKSFREDCQKFFTHKQDRLCSNHPHNYYLEILTDTGIIGILNILLIGILFIIFLFKNLKFFSKSGKENLILLACVISIFLEVFPFRSAGSIFTTQNATYLVLISSILLSYRKLLGAGNFKLAINKNL